MTNLTHDEVQTLARYNAERFRGIMHTPEWREKMAALQATFNADREAPDAQVARIAQTVGAKRAGLLRRLGRS